MVASQLLPSFGQGFARRAADSRHPLRWRELSGLWYPPLGVTGDTLLDLSGYGNDGTPINGPAWWTSVYGEALNFVAASSTYVAIPDGPQVNLLPNESFSLAVRFRTSTSASQRLFAKRDSGAPNAGYYAYVSAGGAFVIGFDGGSTSAALIGATAVDDGQWHTAVVRVQGEQGELWIDGALDVAGSDVDFDGGFLSSCELRLGTGTQNPVYLDGDLAGFAIWKRALAVHEMLDPFDLVVPADELADAGSTPPAASAGPFTAALDLPVARPWR